MRGDELARDAQAGLVAVAAHERGRRIEIHGLHAESLGALVAGERRVLFAVAPDHDLEVRPDPEVPADAEQRHVLHRRRILRPVLEQVAQLVREVRVGEQATASGRLVMREAPAPSELELQVPAATRDREQRRAIDPAALLGLGGIEKLGRQRPQDPAGEPGGAIDELHRGPRLRHGPLAEHLAGEQELGAELLEIVRPQGEHEPAAVDARVHVAPIAPARMPQEPQVLLPLGLDLEPDAELGRHRTHVGAAGGGGLEMQRHHFDPAIEQDLRGERAVQSAGQEADRANGFAHAPSQRLSHACISRFHRIELRGFSTQWFSSGKYTRRAGTPLPLSTP